MKQLVTYSKILALILSITFFTACEEEDNPNIDITQGVYIVNEGIFNSNDGAISFIDVEGMVTEDIFLDVNGRSLGDVVQSMNIVNDKGFIVVNNSKKVEVVDINTFESVGVIEGLSNPRQFIGHDNVGYLSNGNFAGKVYVIDVTGYTLTDSIDVGNGPEKMVAVGNTLYVANSGGWTNDSTVSVINTSSNTVETTINVHHNPTDLVVDSNGDIWVICKGKLEYDLDWNLVGGSGPALVKISNDAVEFTLSLGDHNVSSSHIAISNDGNTLYIQESGVYAMSIDDTALPTSKLITDAVTGIDVDPATGDIYTTQYQVGGSVKVYGDDGQLKETINVGNFPNSTVFN